MDIFSENNLQVDSLDVLKVNLKGGWKYKDERVILNFTKLNTIDIGHIFDINYRQGNEFSIIDNKVVDIDFTLKKSIKGVLHVISLSNRFS